jgi:hypothetical protein
MTNGANIAANRYHADASLMMKMMKTLSDTPITIGAPMNPTEQQNSGEPANV